MKPTRQEQVARHALTGGTSASRKPAERSSSRRSLPRRIFTWIALIFNVIIALGLIFSAYAGYIDPRTWGPASLVVFTFPAWLAMAVLAVIVDLMWWRRTSVVPILAMICCAGAITDFFPLNMPHGEMSEAQRKRAFKVLTYNVLAFSDISGEAPVDYNRQIDYILREDADVVCIQEAYTVGPWEPVKVTKAQSDSIHRKYPYVYFSNDILCLLSKYPAEALPIDFANSPGFGSIAGWRIYVDDKVVNVFNVHLRSLFFEPEDKELFRNVAHLDSIDRSDLSRMRSQVLSKVVAAARARAGQVDDLQRYVRRFGGRNALICGDFNDPVGCYALRTLCADDHFRQAYADAAFGPTITYNANAFYFRIDHILYRGCFKPWSVHRGSLRASDHYPLSATFLLE